LASAPQEQTPGVIQGQRYTSKASATSERIQQRRQRGRGGERKCCFFAIKKTAKQTNKNIFCDLFPLLLCYYFASPNPLLANRRAAFLDKQRHSAVAPGLGG
jgi:hypothetical protein